MLVFTILLIIIILGLFIFLFLLKREICSIKKQLQDYSQGIEKPIDIVFIDKNLTDLAAEINKNQAYKKENDLALIRRERHIKELISNISHDLRTPLTAMIGYLQLLQKTELIDEQREYLDIALSRGRYLQTLINDFYDISLLENKSSEPVLTKINLDNILADTVLSFTEQFEEKCISPIITFLSSPTYIIADETMLKRIIINLISNAIRYGTKELQIKILKADYIELIFQNIVEHGKDIDVTRLFEKFYTGDLSRNQSGSGLGLYIVKILAETMNGNVSAQLKDDKLTIKLYLRQV